MLSHLVSAPGDYEGGCGGNIEAVGSIAASAGSILQALAICDQWNRTRVGTHRSGAAQYLIHRFNVHAQCDQVTADLSLSCFSAHDGAHGVFSFLGRQVLAIKQFGNLRFKHGSSCVTNDRLRSCRLTAR